MTGVCLTAALAVPVGWWATREPASAGVPVAEAAAAAPMSAPSPVSAPAAPRAAAAPVPAAPVPARDDVLPELTARPAVPDAPVPAPVRLQVPSLGVDAPVDAVGLTGDGAVVVPERGSQVGWYRFGAAPGAPRGSAVIVGHVDTWDGGPGALYRLSRLEPGAEVVVQREDGGAVAYRVLGRELLPKAELPADALFTTGGPARLVLISCGGPFDEQTRTYRDNVVVVAEPVEAAS